MTTYHILNGDYLADQLRQTKINQDCKIIKNENDNCDTNFCKIKI